MRQTSTGVAASYAWAIMFADDTNIFLSNSNIDDLQDLVNEELSHLAAWLKINKLSLNVKKTHYMVFTNKRSPASTIKLEINNERIEETCKTKFLGVIIDNKLTWKEHINYISGKIARGIGIIIKARKYLNKDSYWVSTILFFTQILHIVIKYGEIHVKHT